MATNRKKGKRGRGEAEQKKRPYCYSNYYTMSDRQTALNRYDASFTLETAVRQHTVSTVCMCVCTLAAKLLASP